jgi:hypothetical protein
LVLTGLFTLSSHAVAISADQSATTTGNQAQAVKITDSTANAGVEEGDKTADNSNATTSTDDQTIAANTDNDDKPIPANSDDVDND